MQINEDIYNWLIEKRYIPNDSGQKTLVIQKNKTSNNLEDSYQSQQDLDYEQQMQPAIPQFTLNEQISQQFQAGLGFKVIIQQLFNYISKSQNYNQNNTIQLPNINCLKEAQAPVAKIYNWNILIDCFKKVNIEINNQDKQNILDGNTEILHNLLKQLYQGFGNTLQDNITYLDNQNQNKPQKYSETLDLARINVNKHITQSKNCLEMFILLICKHFELTPKQAASLFTNNNQYLTHILAKGVKGKFDPIIIFYQDFYANTNHLINLFLADQTKKGIFFTLNALKPGLISKSFDVAQWTARLFSKIGYELDEFQLLSYSWSWFTEEQSGGLKTVMLGFKRHEDLKEMIVSILNMFGKYNYTELLVENMKKVYNHNYKEIYSTYLTLLKCFQDDSTSNQLFNETQVLDSLIDNCLMIGNVEQHQIDIDLILLTLQFITQSWLLFPDKMGQQEYRCNLILQHFTKASKIPGVVQKMAIVQLYNLLERFGEAQNPYAPIIYKQVTFNALENLRNQQIRELHFSNILQIFESIEGIPITVFIDPILKQIQSLDQQFQFQTFDFYLFRYLANSNKVEFNMAIQIMDLLAKIYLNNLVYAQAAYIPLIVLLEKFLDNQSVQDFVNKLVKVSLAMFYSSEKNRKPKIKQLPLYNLKTATPYKLPVPGEMDQEIKKGQHRSQIIEFVKQIISYQNQNLNEKIKKLVTHTLVQLKTFQEHDNKGLVAILKMYNENYQEIIDEYNKELKEQGKSAEEMFQAEVNDNQEEQIDTTTYIDQTLNTSKNYNLSYMNSLQGMKKRQQKQKITKQELTLLALKKGVKAEPRALEQIEEVKNKLNQRKLDQQNKNDTTVQEIEQQKKNLRLQLEKRSLEQGVSNLNKKDQTAELIFEFGSREKDKKNEKKNGLPEILYLNMKEQESRDYNMVDIISKKYNKLLKFFFTKYCSSGFTSKNLQDFDDVRNRLTEINQAEIWKLLKDYKLDKYLTQEEHKTLIRNTCQYFLKQKNITLTLDFQGFNQYFIQFCHYINTKENQPRQNMKHLPISQQIQSVILEMREIHIINRQSTALYDEPELSYHGEKDVIQQYNENLKINPNYPIPSGFKKIQQKEIQFKYQLSSSLLQQIPESYNYCYSIVQDIINDQFKISGIEPISQAQNTVKAIPKYSLDTKNLKPQYLDHFKDTSEIERENQKPLRQKRSQSYQPLSNDPFNKPATSGFDKPRDKYGKQRTLQIEPKKKLSLGLKLGISNFNFRDKYTAEQVAYVLDDIIEAVEQGKQEVQSHKKHINPIIRERMLQSEKEKQMEEEEKKRLQIRKQRLKSNVDEIKKIRIKKKEEDEIKKKQEQIQKQDNSDFKEDRKWVYLEKQKDILIQKQEEKRKKEQEKQEILEKEKLQKQKENKEKVKQLNKKQKEELKKIIESRKKKIQNLEEQTLSQNEVKQKFQEEHSRQREETAKIVKEIENDNNIKISELYKQSGVQRVLSQNQQQIQGLFHFLQDQTYRKLKTISSKALPLQTIQWFTYNFRITPEILPLGEVKMMYQSVQRNNTDSQQKDGINYEQFMELLVRCSIKGKQIFNKFYQNLSQEDKNNDQSQIQNQQNDGSDSEDDNKSTNQQFNADYSKLDISPILAQHKDKKINIVDDYGNINLANKNTLQCLLYYLGIPADKPGMILRFKQILEAEVVPDKIRKEELKKKLEQNPKTFIIKSPEKVKYKKIINRNNNINVSKIISGDLSHVFNNQNMLQNISNIQQNQNQGQIINDTVNDTQDENNMNNFNISRDQDQNQTLNNDDQNINNNNNISYQENDYTNNNDNDQTNNDNNQNQVPVIN